MKLAKPCDPLPLPSPRSVSEYSKIVFQKHNWLCATWNQTTTCSTKSDYSDTLLEVAQKECAIRSSSPAGIYRDGLRVRPPASITPSSRHQSANSRHPHRQPPNYTD